MCNSDEYARLYVGCLKPGKDPRMPIKTWEKVDLQTYEIDNADFILR